MSNNTAQENRDDDIGDLPFEVQAPASENLQNLQNYEPAQEGEEWIHRALAAIRVREAVAYIARGPEKIEQERTTKAKAAFLEIFAKNFGTIGDACDKCNIARDTFYLWKRTDHQFKSSIARIEQDRHDMVEDEIFAAIQKHDGSMIRFYAERRMPEYKSKSQMEVVTGDKTFEDLIYDQAQKRKALAEGKDPNQKTTHGVTTK